MIDWLCSWEKSKKGIFEKQKLWGCVKSQVERRRLLPENLRTKEISQFLKINERTSKASVDVRLLAELLFT